MKIDVVDNSIEPTQVSAGPAGDAPPRTCARCEASGLAAGLSHDNWVFHPRERVLTAPNQRPVTLTLTESRLLSAIVAQAPPTATRQQLVQALGLDFLYEGDRRIEVSISRLRKKIQSLTGLPAPIKAHRNVGYIFQAPCDMH